MEWNFSEESTSDTWVKQTNLSAMSYKWYINGARKLEWWKQQVMMDEWRDEVWMKNEKWGWIKDWCEWSASNCMIKETSYSFRI